MLFDRGSRHKIYIETMERELKRLEDGDLAGIRFVYSAEWQILPSRFWGRGLPGIWRMPSTESAIRRWHIFL